jgi:hypothetical protein
MARSRISGREIDLQKDNGSVLWSFIQGEQLAYQIAFDWIDNMNGMTVEAVVVEAKNTPGEIPSEVLPSGKQDKLTVYQPPYKSEWSNTVTYAKADLVHVALEGKYYQSLIAGNIGHVPSASPTQWVEYGPNNIITILFPSTLSVNYAVAPLPDKPIYAYFELALNEPTSTFSRSWKPMRGLVEFLFSPTQIVP